MPLEKKEIKGIPCVEIVKIFFIFHCSHRRTFLHSDNSARFLHFIALPKLMNPVTDYWIQNDKAFNGNKKIKDCTGKNTAKSPFDI